MIKNKKIIKDLLIILISLFILSACKHTDIIGLPGQDALDNAYTDSFTVKTYSVKDDSVYTSNPIYNLLGYFNDPEFGSTQADMVFQVASPASDVQLQDSTTKLDSLVLVLAYQGFYGDSNTSFTASVHQLTQAIHIDSSYYSNSRFSYDSLNTIGSKTFVAKVNTYVSVKNEDLDTPNKTVLVYPQLRIRLNDALGDTFLNKKGILTDNTTFQNYFKGMYVRIDKNVSGGNGGLIYFNTSSAIRSYLRLYYHQKLTDSTVQNKIYTFTINSGSARVNIFKHDYTGSAAGAELADSNKGKDLFYLQPLGGIRAILKFPNLEKTLNQEKVAINKAELIVTISPGSDLNYVAPSSLILRAKGEDGLQYQATAYLKGNQYLFIINTHLQDILSKRVVDKELYFVVGARESIANRVILGGGANSSYRARLKLTFTKL